jgi:hypothetical protein
VKDFTNDGIQASNADVFIERGAGFFTKPESDPTSGSLSIWGNGFEFEGTIEYCRQGAPDVTMFPTATPQTGVTSSPTPGIGCDALSTLIDGSADLEVKAVVFDLTATTDIIINEFLLRLNNEIDLVIEIWTKVNTWSLDEQYPYVGTAWDKTGWIQVLSMAGVTGSGSAQLTNVGAFTTPVTMMAGSVQSFYIWTSTNSALVKDFTNDGKQASNADLFIERGAGFYTKPESDPTSGSLSIWGNGFEFEGTIEYCQQGA